MGDYAPKTASPTKIKKSASTLTLELVKNKDIAFEMGQKKQAAQINVGFALETDNELQNAQQKLHKKNFDLIVLNSLQDQGAGFGHNTNKVTFIDREHTKEQFPLKSKLQVAVDIADKINSLLTTKVY